ncbi:radical SAM family protein [Desulfobotulus alkaliphilus]|uniref:Radical SAM family protein n=1 Tax=Desulfobotulus alkaliphilus TaxID=622671 RepID=A0A562R730_9BACT|nr:radical SAM protein [Desulfobotulus alkaliphilus]TWI64176.1 radical SAM family protein [Desulfobotulus alkaliphilus]
MSEKKKETEVYAGFEQGPIRPPSEAGSLLIRVTRNCPWNRCRFCPVYKGTRFSLRPMEHVLADIDTVHGHLSKLQAHAAGGPVTRDMVMHAGKDLAGPDLDALHATLHWMAHGMDSVFLQDANSLIMKPDNLITVLRHIMERFPWISRITSYARSQTIKGIPDDRLQAMADAGLNRIHVGMESGCDAVLERIQKGVTRDVHILAGQKVKAAGISLSEYVMPGLGGRDLSEAHAMDTADALNRINPDFIRLRTLALPQHTELYGDWQAGHFDKCSGEEVARELLGFIMALEGIQSTLTSDHVLNLFETVAGRLPEDKSQMIAEIQSFLDLPEHGRMMYQVGRRMGLYRGMKDFKDEGRRQRVAEACQRYNIRPDNLEEVLDDLMRRFI